MSEEAIAGLEREGARGARTLDEFVAGLARTASRLDHGARRRSSGRPSTGWRRCSPGDTIVDGGNSWYRDDVDRSGPLLRDHGIHYLDVGTSGGIHGFERGYCLMVGGDADAVAQMAPIFDTLAPGRRGRRAHTRPHRRPRHRRAGLAALRPVRVLGTS